MQSSDLKSRAWCDIVFEHRNKEYGAYRLRQQAGARYRYALFCVFSGLFVIGLTYIGYLHFRQERMEANLLEAERMLSRMIPAELNSSYQIRMVSTARLAPAPLAAEGENDEIQGTPVIVDEVTQAMKAGVKKAIQFKASTEWMEDEATELSSSTEAPPVLVKHKIIRTDDVSELPEFPGGARAFMQWLDKNLVYPRHYQRRGIEGEVTLSFIVLEDGYPTDFRIVSATHPLFGQTALNGIKRMPRWKPGKNPQGQPTAAMITVPIVYKR